MIKDGYCGQQKFCVLSGISASGKSTFAYEAMEHGWWIASRDRIRKQYFGTNKSVLSFQDEEKVSLIEKKDVLRALKNGDNVMVDDTNLRIKYVKEWIELVKSEFPDVTITLATFYEIPVDECIKRDKERSDSVGEEVIRKQYQILKSNRKELEKLERMIDERDFSEFDLTKKNQIKYCSFKVEPYIRDWNKPKCIWVDIDGTLAKAAKRQIYDYTKVISDEPYLDVVDVVNCIKRGGIRIIVFSGREDSCKEDTINWLIKHKIEFDEIHMRKTGDRRSDDIVKSEMFNEFIRNRYNCIGAFDDRPRVGRLIEELGVTLFKLGPLDYEF